MPLASSSVMRARNSSVVRPPPRGRGVDAVAIVGLRLITALSGHPRTPCAWVTARVYSCQVAVPLAEGERWSALSPRCARPVWPWKPAWNWVKHPHGDCASQHTNNWAAIYEMGIMQWPIFPLSYCDAAKLLANGLKPVGPASLLAGSWFTLA